MCVFVHVFCGCCFFLFRVSLLGPHRADSFDDAFSMDVFSSLFVQIQRKRGGKKKSELIGLFLSHADVVAKLDGMEPKRYHQRRKSERDELG